MQAHFAFGKTGLTVSLPPGPRYQVLTSRSAVALENPKSAIESALDQPIAGPPLRELAAGKKSVAIAVCDITRPAPNRQTLPPLLKQLHQAGIPPEAVTILIATGLHRAATPAELDVILGPEIAAHYRVENHHARRKEEQCPLGHTRRGTPVWIDARFIRADLRITLGFIEQHLMAGFSGGRKLVAPGLAGEDTIKVLHSPRFMREPGATEGSIEDNPLHAELLEIAHIARQDFILDVTMTLEREISGVFAGDPAAAHGAGVAFLQKSSLERLPELADAAITSGAGYPLDLTFYQTVKGITAAQHVVKPGGRILLLGECAEGIGSAEFAEMLRSFTGPEPFLRAITDAEVVVDQWQLEKLALMDQRHELFFYTPGAEKSRLGSLAEKSYHDIDVAVEAFVQGLPAQARVALIPEGPYVFAAGPVPAEAIRNA